MPAQLGKGSTTRVLLAEYSILIARGLTVLTLACAAGEKVNYEFVMKSYQTKNTFQSMLTRYFSVLKYLLKRTNTAF